MHPANSVRPDSQYVVYGMKSSIYLWNRSARRQTKEIVLCSDREIWFKEKNFFIRWLIKRLLVKMISRSINVSIFESIEKSRSIFDHVGCAGLWYRHQF